MINIFGPINNLGVGVHCYNLAKAYCARGREVCLIPPFGRVHFEDDLIKSWLSNRSTFSVNNPSIMIFDVQFLTQFSGTPRIGFAVFETDGFTDMQKSAMKSCDFLLTPSKWGKEVLASYGFKAEVVNEGIDPVVFPIVPSRINSNVSFIHVGKLEERKGTLQVIRCFKNALERKHAELVMHCHNGFIENGGYNELATQLMVLGFNPVGGAVSFQPWSYLWRYAGLTIRLSMQTVGNLSEIYGMSDCGIFPSKGEGWGLPIQECIASGVPAIVGSWSGQSEYIRMDYPQELAFDRSRKELAIDGAWFHGDRGNWNVVDDEQLIAKIEWAYENARILRASERWAKTVEGVRAFTWERAAGQLDDFLKQF